MKNQEKFTAVAMLFVTMLLTSNLMATKLITVFGLVLPGAAMVYPLCFMAGDVLTEVWGFQKTKRVLLLGLIMQSILTFFTWLGVFLPYPEFFAGQEAYSFIFNSVPRITAASLVGYYLGGLLNGWSLEKIKEYTGMKLLFVRTIGSSAIGLLFDTIVFILIAFYGTMPLDALGQMILVQYLVKIGIQALAGTPLTYTFVKWVRK